MAKKIAVLIDGGHLRSYLKKARKPLTADYIELVGLRCTATISANRSVDLIAVMTNDSDCIPARKLVRRAGLQVALLCIPGCRPAPELLAHSDFKRNVNWP